MKKIVAILIVIAALFLVTTVRAEPALKTQTSNDIGLSLSSYQYQEPGLMSLKGIKIGLDAHVVRVSEERDKLIFRGDLRYAFGSVDYSSNGTGSRSGEPDWYVEARGTVGKDLEINGAVISPYTGLGYRYLFNDGRGLSCTGGTCYFGYRRESNYIYLPVGMIHRMALYDQARLETTLEYDYLMVGTQNTHLSDGGAGYGDLTNNQSSGYGLKFSVMYLKNNWVLGPFVHYWNIDQSDTTLVYQNGTPVAIGWEPKNNTMEFGFKASQRF